MLVACAAAARAEETLAVLPGRTGGVAPAKMMREYLMGKVREALGRRKAAVEAIKTPEDYEAYQRRMRDFFIEQLGGLPERTPLRARTTGVLQRDGYRIEKVIYESQPGLLVTALLYLPDGKPPYPGVLVPCGHSATGKQADTYQLACILLVRNGMAALCYDPIDQGERIQLLTAGGKPIFQGVAAHGQIGKGSMLLGRNTATFHIWDGIRGLDYLASREEIDPDRLGCTGNSGGGTLTSYLMALDPRIKCAAPACYLTSMARLLETAGPQDAEQNIHGQIGFGMDHADFLHMRAPQPTLMCTATRDFFDVGGAWDTFREAKRLYGRLGFPERVDLVEADEKHGFSVRLREGAVRWMRRWLLGRDDAIVEPDLTSLLLAPEEAWCTPTGQVVRLDGTRTTYELNIEYESELARRREAIWAGADHAEALDAVRRVSGIRRLADLPEPEVETAGRLERDGYHVEKLVLQPEPRIWLPGLLLVPERSRAEAYLFVDDRGKARTARPGGEAEKLAKAGHLVLVLDVRSTGETMPRGKGYHAGAIRDTAAIAYLLGTSYLKMQAEDVLTAARFLSAYQSPEGPRLVRVVAHGLVGPAALHAAALGPPWIEHLTLEESLDSWAGLVRDPMNKEVEYVELVHGALGVYDLPNLRAALGRARLDLR